MKKLLSLTLLAAFALTSHAADAPNTLGKIKSSKSITLAYAQNAAPFSFDDTKAFKRHSSRPVTRSAFAKALSRRSSGNSASTR